MSGGVLHPPKPGFWNMTRHNIRALIRAAWNPLLDRLEDTRTDDMDIHDEPVYAEGALVGNTPAGNKRKRED